MMAVPIAGPKRLVIVGATGIVGGFEQNRQLRKSAFFRQIRQGFA
jgi:hypothetical protein